MNRLLSASFIFLLSCSGDVEFTKPENVIDSRKMAKVIADVQLIESIGKVTADGLRLNKDSVNAYESVFKHHEINANQFKASMEYYSMMPDTLELIYERTLEVLSEKQASMDAGKQH